MVAITIEDAAAAFFAVDEKTKYRYTKSLPLFSLLFDLDNELRGIIKYAETDESEDVKWAERTRSWISDRLREAGIEIEEGL